MFIADTGRLMARYCVALETMKNLHGVKGNEKLEELVLAAFEYLCRNLIFLLDLSKFILVEKS